MDYKKIPANRDIRLTFLGCGNITKKHARLVKKLGSNVSTGFASRSSNKSETYRKSLNGEKAYASYEDAIMDEWADIIMICTPPKYHFDLAKQALLAGKHIIIEKPPLFKSSDFDLLAKIAEPNGLQILVAENYFYRPMRTKLTEILHSGVIGDVKFIHISAVKEQIIDDWRGDQDEVGFGALFEGGIHWISIMNNLGFDTKKARGFLPAGEPDLEKSIQATLESDGPVINLIYSWDVNSVFKGLRISRIFGTKGSVRFESNGLFTFVRGKKWKLSFFSPSKMTGFKLMFDDFFESLVEGKPAQYHMALAKKDLMTVERIYKTTKE